MRRRYRYTWIGILYILTIGTVMAVLSRHGIAVFNPMGTLAAAERHLIYVTLALSLIVVIPVFIMLFGFAWRYRESNASSAAYRPDWEGNHILESIWWLIPLALITVLSVITWNSSHELDPYRPLATSANTMTIQVVSLDWKWLFIYPDEHIATVNYLEIPTNTAVHFVLTSDAPMNSFWVPQLSGQVYTMPAMSTQLSIMATKDGDYKGSSANISGKGFAGMTFTVRSRDRVTYNSWLSGITSENGTRLDTAAYAKLAQPSEDVRPMTYGVVEDNLFNTILSKYEPSTNGMNMHNNNPGTMKGMDMSGMSM